MNVRHLAGVILAALVSMLVAMFVFAAGIIAGTLSAVFKQRS